MIHLVWPITFISDSDTNILIMEEIFSITSSSSIFDQDQSYLFRHIIYQIMLMNIGCSLRYLRKCWTEKFTSITNLVHICFKKYIPHNKALPSICIAKIYTVHIMKEFQMSANVVNVGEWPYFCDVFLNEWWKSRT